LEAGGAARAGALDDLRGSVRHLAFEQDGCRVVQLALQVADPWTAAGLAKELQGSLREAAMSLHANHVLQRIIEVLPSKHAAFLVDELRGAAVELAKHCYGCRTLVRAFEYMSHTLRGALADEVLAEAGALAGHRYGHYVLVALLEHGCPGQRAVIASALRRCLHIVQLNRHTWCRVLEVALLYCETGDQDDLAADLLSTADGVVRLAQSPHGLPVVQALLSRRDSSAALAAGYLRREAPQLRASKYGRLALEGLPACR